MATLKKIGTCGYCQARVVISVTAGSRHELVCTACGAPLDHTEVLAQVESPQPVSLRPEPSSKTPHQDSTQRRKRDDDAKRDRQSDSRKPRKAHDRKPRKRKPRGLRYWVKKIIDEIKDFFD